MPANETHRIPSTLVGYRIQEKIGEGGMSLVYLAEQPSLDRQVALKLLSPQMAADPARKRRFLREGRLAGRINHTNVVTYHECREVKGWCFMTLEYVDGGDLRQLVGERGGQLPERLALGLARDIACGLEACHRRGVVHRDIKPHNILVSKEMIPKIADFSASQPAAAALQRDDEDHQAGLIVGSPGYMAPEQTESHRYVGPVCDIYSLGATLFFMLTGRPPFREASARDTIKAMQTQATPDPRQFCKQDLKEGTIDLIMTAMEKKPKHRYPTAREFVEQVELVLHEDGPSTPAGLPQHSSDTRRITNLQAIKSINWAKF